MEPHSLVNLGRRWYIVGWDRGRDDWRTFRIDRITRPAANGVRFAARKLPTRDAAAYVEQGLSGARTGYEARVTVHAPVEQIQKRVPWISGSLTRIDDRRCEYRTADDDLEWLALRIAMLGADVDVDGPPELLAQLDALGRRLRRAASPSLTPPLPHRRVVR